MSVYKLHTIYVLYRFTFEVTEDYPTYTLSLHDALPISLLPRRVPPPVETPAPFFARCSATTDQPFDQPICMRSEEHTSELQSRGHLVCRLLLEKKKMIAR